ncbi:MAG: hypothetical protein FJ098_03395, partial [Deltaproteobacteria bacterium]|nr:hypothetical protein [Deltaproteobacteria bacterium]
MKMHGSGRVASAGVAGFVLALLAGCQGDDKTGERVERLEQRVQATEFQLSGLTELEPRIFEALAKSEGTLETKLQEHREATRQMTEDFKAAHTGMKTDLGDHLRRLELVEAWIQEKDKEEEQKKLFAIEDGEIPPAWEELYKTCQMNDLGQAQTVLNFLVRINAYMSDFPVHHPVTLAE